MTILCLACIRSFSPLQNLCFIVHQESPHPDNNAPPLFSSHSRLPFPLSVSISLSLSVCLSVCLCFSLSLSLPVCLSFSLSLSLSLFFSLSLSIYLYVSLSPLFLLFLSPISLSVCVELQESLIVPKTLVRGQTKPRTSCQNFQLLLLANISKQSLARQTQLIALSEAGEPLTAFTSNHLFFERQLYGFSSTHAIQLPTY